jgi:hypothetical protein
MMTEPKNEFKRVYFVSLVNSVPRKVLELRLEAFFD